MNHLLACCTCLVVALVAQAQQPAYEVRTWAALADRDWSPVALRLRRTEAARWTYLEGPGFIAAGRSLRQLEQAAQEVGAVQTYFTSHLARPMPDQRAVILLVGDPESWRDLVDRSRLRRDGDSLQAGREVFIEASQSWKLGRVAHEMAHYLVRPPTGLAVPLWVEEGLALRWGGEALRQAGLTSEVPRQVEGIAASNQLPWDEVMALTSYPAATTEALAFYRQAEEMVSALAVRLGERGLADFVQDLTNRRGDWRAALAARQWDDAQIQEWQAEVRAAVQQAKVRP